MPDALQLLREDHNKVKDLFQRFERSDNSAEKKRIAKEAFMELKVHTQIEEEIFYPAMRKQLGDNELMHEAEEEHHVVDLVMEELESKRLDDKTFAAKFTVMAENVKHHIQEEEGEMFPKAAEAGRTALDRVGRQLEERKMELMEEMKRPQRRRATAGSRNGRSTSRAGRTSRTTARSRSTTASRSRAGTASKTRKTASRSGTRSTTARGGTRSAASRARGGGASRARKTTGKATATRTTGTRSRTMGTTSTGTRSRTMASRGGGASRARSTTRTTATSKRAPAKRRTTTSRSRR